MLPITLSDLTPHLHRAQRPSGQLRYLCPFCDTEGSHRDNLSLADHGFRCHRCGKTGSLARLAEHLGIRPPAPVRTPEDFEREIQRRLGPRGMDVLNWFKVCVRERENGKPGRKLVWKLGQRDRIRVIGDPAWDGPKSYWDQQTHLPVETIYGLDQCVGKRVVYLVGGEMDVWAAWASGQVPAFSFTNGEGFVPQNPEIERIARAGIATIRVLYDADAAGERGSLKVAAALRAGLDPDKTTVELVRWFPGATRGFDVADLCASRAFNGEQVREALAHLACEEISPAPPGGFWWPAGVSFAYPRGYVLGEHGTYQVAETKQGVTYLKRVSPIPLWLEERYADVDTHGHAVALCAQVDRHRVKRIVPQSAVSAANNIPALADQGFVGLTSENARDIVRYVAAAQAANLANMPTRETVSRMGWRNPEDERKGARSFIHGITLLHPDGTEEVVDPGVRSGAIARILADHEPRGSLEEEARALASLVGFPVPMTLYLASLASALNEPLDAPVGVWQVADESSSGKTTALQVATSCWANPKNRKLISMNATGVGIEVLLSSCNSVSLCLDELKSFGRGRYADEQMVKLVYMISEGTGRTRSNRSITLQEPTRWTCNVLVTGEHQLSDVGEDTGIQARVFAFWGKPFGATTRETAELLKGLKRVITANHGNVGRAFVKAVMRKSLDDLRDTYDRAQARLVDEAPREAPDNFVERWSEHYATLAVAGWLLEDIVSDLPRGSTFEALLETWRIICTRGQKTSYAERSLEAVREFVAQRWPDFEGVPNGSANLPMKRDTVGRIHDDGRVSLLPNALKKHLEENGFDLPKAENHWETEGWLKLPSSRGKRDVARINGKSVRCIVFQPGVIDGAGDVGDAPTSRPAKGPVPPSPEQLESDLGHR